MIKLRLLSIALASGALFVSMNACGGKVVFVAGGAGGASSGMTNSSVASGPVSTSSSTHPTATVGVGGSSPQSECEKFCQAAGAHGCPTADCVMVCEAEYAKIPSCAAQFTALLECTAANEAPNCQLGGSCPNEESALLMCEGVTPGSSSSSGTGGGCTEACSAGDNHCNCSTTCGGTTFMADCSFGADGMAQCKCVMNDAFVGTCSGNNLSCDTSSSCCSQFFVMGL
jgi:hypothetical protein